MKEKVLEIINEAKLIMKEMDIPQWQNPNYPTKDDLLLDIEEDNKESENDSKKTVSDYNNV